MSAGSVSSYIPGVLVPLAVLIVFALARKYFAAKAAAPTPEYELPWERLDERFQTTQYFVAIGILLLIVVIAWAGYQLLLNVNLHFARAEGPAHFILLPSSAIWWFLPGFCALTFAWDVALFIWACFGNSEDARRYAEWTDRKAGFNAGRLLHWIALIVVLPIGILTLLALPLHTTLHEDELRIREYASLSPHHYRYSDAQRMSVIKGLRLRNGTFRSRAAIEVDFSDGRKWSSADNRDFVRFVDPDLVAFLHQKTGLPIVEADTREDIPK